MEQMLTAVSCLVDIIKDNETLTIHIIEDKCKHKNRYNINVSRICWTPAFWIQNAVSHFPWWEMFVTLLTYGNPYILFSTFQEDKTLKGSLFNGTFISLSLLLTKILGNFKTRFCFFFFNFCISVNVCKTQLVKTSTFIKEMKALIWVGVSWIFMYLSFQACLHALFRNSTKLTCLFPKSLTSLSFF